MKANNTLIYEIGFKAKHDKHAHDAEKDLCSPFCSCSCCGSQVVNHFQSIIIDFPIPFEGIKTQLPTYKSIFTSNFFGSIWQPPQIV
ncbi:hypothetical protein I5M07_00355 [Flavobacterium sp. SE-1-e]|uniref:Uncharacterized protein n=2 Tax=Flavobacterium agrisoli TaxID=2793066 RepID=A0A934UHY7_9FLAO|nr:hypothetical protein [Flavobacterium agrisoli]MBK0368267.1 hypothetical protein [Flavobacterium agrisoli]